MKIIALGTGGWIPESKQTSCFLIDNEESFFLQPGGFLSGRSSPSGLRIRAISTGRMQ